MAKHFVKATRNSSPISPLANFSPHLCPEGQCTASEGMIYNYKKLLTFVSTNPEGQSGIPTNPDVILPDQSQNRYYFILFSYPTNSEKKEGDRQTRRAQDGATDEAEPLFTFS